MTATAAAAAQGPSSWRLGRRPALDGLRGWAVLLVLASHTGLDWTGTAGTVGVNVFFVLSGFLITRLLVEEHADTGGISLRRFFIRRGLRIYPAMVAFLPVTALVGWTYGQPLDQVVYAGLYVANFVRAAGNSLPLLPHTWSLSMEEQFYFVWPPLLVWLFSRRWDSRRLARWAAGAIVLTLVARVVMAAGGASLLRLHNDPLLASGMLAAGCLLGLTAHRVLPAAERTTPPVRRAGLAASTVVLLGLSVMEKSVGFYVWGLTLVMVASLAVIVVLVVGRSGEVGAFTWRPIAWLGQISYGLYLWHYTVFFVVKQYVRDQPSKALLQVSISLVVAVASHHLLEQPFLRRKDRYRHDGTTGVDADGAVASTSAENGSSRHR